ncbi:alpha/beta fold hydrolase [Geomicrobium sp. JCM 19039]|uniref:alpha/beta fold hydrolase n=1 Tax=Geomicrobium sp. JCM 19039 TaxID=1460636 RepID=UPI00045F37BE|nr:alpha/beta hydrolase [Geomicrobium sp. JCM 19039]GAK13268.1 putative hydrolase [Geomicrobium sp. JCM 19039]
MAELTVGGIRIHFTDDAQTEKPVCVLLHGFPQSSLTWRYVTPYLANHYRVIMVDLRGYGKSDKPVQEELYTNEIMANDVVEVLDHLDIHQALVVGHDRGARVARRLAYEKPTLVKKLVLIDILPVEYVYQLSAEEAAKKYWHWVFQVVPDLPETLIEGKEEAFLTYLLDRGDGLYERLKADGSFNEYLRDFQQPGAVKAALNDYRATYRTDLVFYKKGVDKLPQDTLLLWGENGNLAGLPVIDVWKQTVARVEGVEIKDCGHYVPEEKPKEVAEYILQFDEL